MFYLFIYTFKILKRHKLYVLFTLYVNIHFIIINYWPIKSLHFFKFINKIIAMHAYT